MTKIIQIIDINERNKEKINILLSISSLKISPYIIQ